VIELRAYQPDHLPTLLRFDLPAEQQVFTSTPVQVLARITGDAERQPVTILDGAVPVGFFLLCVGSHRDKYLPEPDPAAVAFTALSIDPARQGQGVGFAAMTRLPGFIEAHYPEARRVILAVNQRNHTALRLYARAGFVISHTRDGPAGPQWVMECALPRGG
jgi:ribosomal protein S18 acetylase RimI-like enzyme